MKRLIQMQVPAEIDDWVREEAKKGFRSAASIALEALAEKYHKAMEDKQNAANQQP